MKLHDYYVTIQNAQKSKIQDSGKYLQGLEEKITENIMTKIESVVAEKFQNCWEKVVIKSMMKQWWVSKFKL